jgi:hypothetical protein
VNVELTGTATNKGAIKITVFLGWDWWLIYLMTRCQLRRAMD